MTVLEVIQRSSEFLAKKGVESPRLQVELMLAAVLQLPRLKLYLNFDRRLDEDQLNRLRAMVKRRADREPLQHILGSTGFCGLELTVSPAALIPRPETELLCERAWQYLERLASPGRTRFSVLDVGTGSGCLAVTLAVKCPQATVHAVDISEGAIALAQLNAKRHGVSARVSFCLSDLFSNLSPENRFDLIVSNPPYIPTATVETLEPEVRDHDPRPALDGGPDGLLFYRRLAEQAASYLTAEAALMVEFGDDQAEAVSAIFRDRDWIVDELARDLAGKLRFMIAHRQDC